MKTNDLLWKGIIEDLAEDFLLYFFEPYFDTFDLSKGIEFLDKELKQLFLESEDTSRHVDKLLKVFTTTGEEQWILIHVEVQGYHDKDFAERMYIYQYRIFDKFGKNAVALALFTDKNIGFKPNEYKISFMGTEISYKYMTYKVLEQNLQLLRASENPFATIIETVFVALQKGNFNDNDLYELKIDLVKRLIKKNFSKVKIVNILNFIKYYIRFKDSYIGLGFDADIDFITNKTYPMGTNEILLWQAKNEGIEKGEELFLKNNIAKKLEKGLTILEIADRLDVEVNRIIEIINKYGLNSPS